jgi:DNA uptake protein ComE-like DNA-binding protein
MLFAGFKQVPGIGDSIGQAIVQHREEQERHR